jgi:hypothetical protein
MQVKREGCAFPEEERGEQKVQIDQIRKQRAESREQSAECRAKSREQRAESKTRGKRQEGKRQEARGEKKEKRGKTKEARQKRQEARGTVNGGGLLRCQERLKALREQRVAAAPKWRLR